MKIAGLHLILALNARKKIFELSVLTDQCYQVTTYQTTTGAMLIPEDHSIVDNQGVPPANTSVWQEDPRKEALDRGKDAGDRVRIPYQCGKCGSTNGHNRASFRRVEA